MVTFEVGQHCTDARTSLLGGSGSGEVVSGGLVPIADKPGMTRFIEASAFMSGNSEDRADK